MEWHNEQLVALEWEAMLSDDTLTVQPWWLHDRCDLVHLAVLGRKAYLVSVFIRTSYPSFNSALATYREVGIAQNVLHVERLDNLTNLGGQTDRWRQGRAARGPIRLYVGTSARATGRWLQVFAGLTVQLLRGSKISSVSLCERLGT